MLIGDIVSLSSVRAHPRRSSVSPWSSSASESSFTDRADFRRYFRKHCQELLEANHFRRTQSISASPSEEKGIDRPIAEPLNITAGIDDSRSRACDSPEVGMTSMQRQHDGASLHVSDGPFGVQAERFRRREGLRARTRGKSLRIDPVISSPKSQHVTISKYLRFSSDPRSAFASLPPPTPNQSDPYRSRRLPFSLLRLLCSSSLHSCSTTHPSRTTRPSAHYTSQCQSA